MSDELEMLQEELDEARRRERNTFDSLGYAKREVWERSEEHSRALRRVEELTQQMLKLVAAGVSPAPGGEPR